MSTTDVVKRWMLTNGAHFLVATSQLGPVALATQSVLLVSSSTSYQAPYAVSVATSVRYGCLLASCTNF